MLRLLIVSLLISVTIAVADERDSPKLAASDGWGGETIQLPPGFARDMKLKRLEHIRFAPGMMKAESESFFCYLETTAHNPRRLSEKAGRITR